MSAMRFYLIQQNYSHVIGGYILFSNANDTSTNKEKQETNKSEKKNRCVRFWF
jgi:hypothetical protein